MDSFKKIGDIERIEYKRLCGIDKQSTAIITLETDKTDPWMLFLYVLKAPATRDNYIQRLTKFLDFLGYTGTKEEKARAFAIFGATIIVANINDATRTDATIETLERHCRLLSLEFVSKRGLCR